MAPPSQLAIATSVVKRLVKEETSYRQELEQQRASIAKLEHSGGNGDENAGYQLRQEKKGVEETQALFPQLKERLQDALAKLQQQLVSKASSVLWTLPLTHAQQERRSEQPEEEIAAAREAAAAALESIRAAS